MFDFINKWIMNITIIKSAKYMYMYVYFFFLVPDY